MAQAAPALVARGGSSILGGESPRLLVTGVAPGERVVVQSFRTAQVWKQGVSQPTLVLAHAFAEFTADKDGRVDIDRATPVRGTYDGADPLGLLWSGEKADLTGDVKLAENEVLFRLERNLQTAAETRITLTDGADRLDVAEVKETGLSGVFARPKIAGPWPAIILLHGSEGGTRPESRDTATRFAHLGYAALAVNYFAWPYAHIEGIPQALVNIPVETIEKARAWLKAQPHVNAERVTLWGASKGAELALVAAAHYDWVERVVGCVPSSLVWEGFGRALAANEVLSSWTIAGRSLPYIPYDHFEDYTHGKLSMAAVHQRSLDVAPKDRAEAARIPIEKTHARLLLLGAERDQIWPSAPMTRQIQETMRRAGRAKQVTAFVFDESDHLICGTGSSPTRINPVIKPEGNSPTPEASARAAAKAWAETKKFLARP